jgi:hypothetical protein
MEGRPQERQVRSGARNPCPGSRGRGRDTANPEAVRPPASVPLAHACLGHRPQRDLGGERTQRGHAAGDDPGSWTPDAAGGRVPRRIPVVGSCRPARGRDRDGRVWRLGGSCHWQRRGEAFRPRRGGGSRGAVAKRPARGRAVVGHGRMRGLWRRSRRRAGPGQCSAWSGGDDAFDGQRRDGTRSRPGARRPARDGVRAAFARPDDCSDCRARAASGRTRDAVHHAVPAQARSSCPSADPLHATIAPRADTAARTGRLVRAAAAKA